MIICIDPGHFQPSKTGKYTDPGACGAKTRECDNALLASCILRDKLQALGVEVLMTRDEKTTQPLNWSRRLAIANTSGVDLVISVHNNSASKDSTGIETLVSGHCGAQSDTMIKADLLHYHMAMASKLRNRGLKRAMEKDAHGKLVPRDLSILDDTKATAILIELGFISNPVEEALLCDKTWLSMTMDGLVKGICSVYDIKPTKPQEPKPNTMFRGVEMYIPYENIEGSNYVKVRDLNLLGFSVGYEKGMVTID